jgi:peptidoglycan/LPS O-acetylase OafA/YrhL
VGAIRIGAKERFETLDLLRGLAALAILTRHFPWPANVVLLFPRSYLAVDLFFALSGFVIAHAYQDRLERGTSTGRFIALRLIRLYPLYAFATLLAAAFEVARAIGDSQPVGLTNLIASLLTALAFMPTPRSWSIDSASFFPLDYPAWSLFWELGINVAYGLLAPRLGAKTIGALILFGLIVVGLAIARFGSLDFGSDWADGPWAGGRALFAFFAGVLVFRLHRRLPAPGTPGWILGAILLLAFVPGLQSPAYDVTCMVVVFPALVWLGASSHNPAPVAAFGRTVGYLSYPIYVLQVPLVTVMSAVERYLLGRESTVPLIVGFASYAAIVIVSGWMAARWLDDPIRAWLRRSLGGDMPSPAAQTAP